MDVGLYFGFSHNNYHACVALVLAKLYSNSFLVLLNTRARVVGGRNWAPDGLHFVPNSRQDSNARPHPHEMPVILNARSAASSLGGVHVHEEVWVNSDEMQMHEGVSVCLPILREIVDTHHKISDHVKKPRSLADSLEDGHIRTV